jgi:hypothetical protein
MKSIIIRILKESVDDITLQKISKRIKLPYFREMGYYGIDKMSDMKKLFSYLLNTEVSDIVIADKDWMGVYNSEGKVVYDEQFFPFDEIEIHWEITKFEDERFPGMWTSITRADGEFVVREFNDDGDVIYLRDENGVQIDGGE